MNYQVNRQRSQPYLTQAEETILPKLQPERGSFKFLPELEFNQIKQRYIVFEDS